VKLSGVCVVHLQDNSEQTIVNGIQSDDDSTYNLHMVIVDGTPAVNAHCVTETLLILFISHYIFNLHYPKHFNLFLYCPVIICGPDEKKTTTKTYQFLRATAVPAGTAVARISYGDSVRLPVCHDPVPNQAQVT